MEELLRVLQYQLEYQQGLCSARKVVAAIVDLPDDQRKMLESATWYVNYYCQAHARNKLVKEGTYDPA